MKTASLFYQAGALTAEGPDVQISVPATSIECIEKCRMADDVNHGDEEFHLIRHATGVLLVGPFVPGGLGAIDRLLSYHPTTRVRSALVGRIPYRYRAAGFLGLRLFPIAGLKAVSPSDLDGFEITTLDDEHV